MSVKKCVVFLTMKAKANTFFKISTFVLHRRKKLFMECFSTLDYAAQMPMSMAGLHPFIQLFILSLQKGTEP